jgi:2-polyprenyl-6-methoxyphenol hydroxylase-like FAD-dependent oxidoreductase
MKKEIDAVVVGAGPVDLLTGIELTLRGAHILVLERLASPSKALKAMSIGPLGVEVLMRRGMSTAIDAEEARGLAAMKPVMERTSMDPSTRKFSGHFAGLSLIRSDVQKEPDRRARAVDQQGIEAMLAERSRSLGIEVRRECEVTGFVQHTDGINVEWTTPTGAGQTRCSYLVGCDGGRSLIRKMAGPYRQDRVLLAGDAAHVHSPFGGQGLSLGLVDAVNLGWKLAAVIRGEMPESLLDTYTTERRPVAEAVLANTLAQVAIMRPDPQSGAMRDIMASILQLDDANRLIGEIMTGLSTRYDLGSERDEVGRLIGNRPIRHGDADVSSTM